MFCYAVIYVFYLTFSGTIEHFFSWANVILLVSAAQSHMSNHEIHPSPRFHISCHGWKYKIRKLLPAKQKKKEDNRQVYINEHTGDKKTKQICKHCICMNTKTSHYYTMMELELKLAGMLKPLNQWWLSTIKMTLLLKHWPFKPNEQKGEGESWNWHFWKSILTDPCKPLTISNLFSLWVVLSQSYSHRSCLCWI